MIVRFLKDRRANFAVMTALMLLPLILAAGFAIDGSRYYKARAHLQDAIDTAAIAVAASDEQDKDKLLLQATDFIVSNIADNTIEDVTVKAFESSTDEIKIDGTGLVHTTFMRLANVETMSVAASTLAKRAPIREMEVALVLDNTYSMLAADPATGESRIKTLRTATADLITALLPDGEKGTVSIALVPYADHVNVGASNKNATWLQMNGTERDVITTTERVCEWKTTPAKTNVCTKSEKYACIVERDGAMFPEMCTRCTVREDVPAKTEWQCSGGGTTTQKFRFHGCVGTRTSGTLRLSDESPTLRYPGYVETSQICARPIIPLTKDRATLLTAAAGMTHKPGGYEPNTHIPSGLVWGFNVLSPSPPFTDAQAYDLGNQNPRKILILMTDGDNTLKYSKNTGKHESFNAANKASEAAAVDADSVAICSNMKKKGIEIYSVAFAITKPSAKAVVRNCATNSATYYDATDAAALKKAFHDIVTAIGAVRIAR